ncbi:MAG: translation initiation factor eIF-2B subunit [Candidatus Dojkabacteria bacterium]|nr:translation initiation factor eIF-2B subunit [Candidatus Dojkabacteria bacterium]
MSVKQILDIEKDIKELNIQGATNVAIATLEGMKIFIEESNVSDKELFYKELERVGNKLANARLNEPLARNGVKYVTHLFKKKKDDLHSINDMKQQLLDYCDEYLFKISDSKRSIIELGLPYVKHFENVLTHCHSSTAVAILKGIGGLNSSFDVVCTETRPLFQGRTTAKSLLDDGISTTMIADSAAESFIIGRGSVSIDAIFIGCDQITLDGYCINKIGSWGIGMAANLASKPLYVVSPLLKVDPYIKAKDISIEIREDDELWSEAPKELKMFNPAFEIVDAKLITGFMTEFGIIKPEEIHDIVRAKYTWLFDD